jgi:acyl-CoA reductase-like NAD-dependent aldehyde dehydrogenase
VAQGARLLAGNQRDGALYAAHGGRPRAGEMTVVREETFGPVSPIITFGTSTRPSPSATARPTA